MIVVYIVYNLILKLLSCNVIIILFAKYIIKNDSDQEIIFLLKMAQFGFEKYNFYKDNSDDDINTLLGSCLKVISLLLSIQYIFIFKQNMFLTL